MSNQVGSNNWAAIRRAYQLWEQWGDLETPDDPHLHGRIARQLTREGLVQGKSSTRKVRDWITHPERYSPTVDAIAVERALRFDLDAIANLTALEHRIWMERLAAGPGLGKEYEGDSAWAALPSKTRGEIASASSAQRSRGWNRLDGGNRPASTLVNVNA